MLNKKLLGSVSKLPEDDNFENVTLLLNGDGTNGGQNNTFVDSSTNNFTITRNGNTTQGSFSPYGDLWSVSNTTGDYFTLPSAIIPTSGSATWTIEGFVFPTSTTGNIMFVTQAIDQSASRFTIYILENGTIGINRASTNIVTTTGTVTLNSWNHIAITRNGSAFTVWINGTSAGTGTNANAIDNTATKLLGVFSGNGQEFKGYVSNLRITNTVVYSSTFTPATQNLTAISGTQLLTFQSNRFVDNSSNAHAITVSGTPSVQRFSPFEPSAPYSTSVIGGSGYFAPNGSYLSISDGSNLASPGSGDFTLESWVYLPTAISNSLGASAFYHLKNDTGLSTTVFIGEITSGGALNVSTGTALISGGTAGLVKTGQWNHLVISRVSGTMRTFINGVQDKSFSNSTTYNGSVVQLGAWRYSAEDYSLLGYMSDCRFVKGSGVTSVTVPTAPLTAITNTSLLCNFTNASIADLAMQNDLETVGNAQVSTSVKKFGTGSLYFDGDGDSLKTVNAIPVGTGNATVEFWIYPTSSSVTYRAIFDSRSTAGTNTGFGIFQYGLTIEVYGNGLKVSSAASALTIDAWNHVALTRSSGTCQIYINGVASGSSGSYSDNLTSKSIIIGNTPSGTAFPYLGYIDDLRVTNGLARYTTTFTPPTTLPTY